ncbi:hypothetical protein C3K47_04235 [Solitalea longa]|uniref:Uncharacterized protein n=1 Tax=Solitalea longa TaxID=2079460 RepID=A0A2S5A7M9_9SPHI|nr:hypothetical protein [Solitalea longa]POY38610.1 hypothetical protein C3K47_04235 [Solitalea longa]
MVRKTKADLLSKLQPAWPQKFTFRFAGLHNMTGNDSKNIFLILYQANEYYVIFHISPKEISSITRQRKKLNLTGTHQNPVPFYSSYNNLNSLLPVVVATSKKKKHQTARLIVKNSLSATKERLTPQL